MAERERQTLTHTRAVHTLTQSRDLLVDANYAICLSLSVFPLCKIVSVKMGGQLDKRMLHRPPATCCIFQLFIIICNLANKVLLLLTTVGHCTVLWSKWNTSNWNTYLKYIICNLYFVFYLLSKCILYFNCIFQCNLYWKYNLGQQRISLTFLLWMDAPCASISSTTTTNNSRPLYCVVK